jgi:hypothetical protein
MDIFPKSKLSTNKKFIHNHQPKIIPKKSRVVVKLHSYSYFETSTEIVPNISEYIVKIPAAHGPCSLNQKNGQ